MSYKKTLETLATYPAYDVIRRDTHKVEWYLCGRNEDGSQRFEFGLEVTDLDADEMVIVNGKRFTISSAVNYAISNNENPVAAYMDAVNKGHDTHWFSPVTVCLHNGRVQHETVIHLELGSLVKFEGIIFEVTEGGTYGLGLKPVGDIAMERVKLDDLCAARERHHAETV